MDSMDRWIRYNIIVELHTFVRLLACVHAFIWIGSALHRFILAIKNLIVSFLWTGLLITTIQLISHRIGWLSVCENRKNQNCKLASDSLLPTRTFFLKSPIPLFTGHQGWLHFHNQHIHLNNPLQAHIRDTLHFPLFAAILSIYLCSITICDTICLSKFTCSKHFFIH